MALLASTLRGQECFQKNNENFYIQAAFRIPLGPKPSWRP